VPTFEDGEVSIYYEEFGSGYPVLLFAPGSLNSSIEWWRNKGPAPFDPTEVFAADFRLIAMDSATPASHGRRSVQPMAGTLTPPTTSR
jgi:pimeloyl-ACP methyl ester carboxylesterase